MPSANRKIYKTGDKFQDIPIATIGNATQMAPSRNVKIDALRPGRLFLLCTAAFSGRDDLPGLRIDLADHTAF